MKKIILAVFLLLGILNQVKAQDKLEIDNNNIIAQHIEGQWFFDAQLTEKLLQTKVPNDDGSTFIFNFEFDSIVADRIQKDLVKYSEIKKIFFAGKGSIGPMKIIFFLFGQNGQTLFMFSEDKKELEWKEYNCLSLAVAAEKENDLLFFGKDGDCANPQIILKRVVEEKPAPKSKPLSTNEPIEVDFNGRSVKADFVSHLSTEEADVQAMKFINQALMGSSKLHLLDVNFILSNQPIKNGLFVFAIESEITRKLTLEIFEEESYSMVAYYKFDVSSGKNYKVVGVKKLKKEAFLIRLTDDDGGELNREFKIK